MMYTIYQRGIKTTMEQHKNPTANSPCTYTSGGAKYQNQPEHQTNHKHFQHVNIHFDSHQVVDCLISNRKTKILYQKKRQYIYIVPNALFCWTCDVMLVLIQTF